MSSEPVNRLSKEVERVACWDCGQEYKATGLSIDGKPVCSRCFNHHDSHFEFDPRCPHCLLEHRIAQKDLLLLEAWQKSREQRETKDASNSEG
jgi:hypothetical protein